MDFKRRINDGDHPHGTIRAMEPDGNAGSVPKTQAFPSPYQRGSRHKSSIIFRMEAGGMKWLFPSANDKSESIFRM